MATDGHEPRESGGAATLPNDAGSGGRVCHEAPLPARRSVKESPATLEQLLKLKVKIVFRPTPGRHGAILADNTMELDPRSHSPLAHTILHELLHALKPLWSETRVRRETTRLWRGATWQQKAALYKKTGPALIWSGEDAVPDDPA